MSSTTDPIDGEVPSTLEVEFPIEEALNGKRPKESPLGEEEIEKFVEWTADIERSKALRELAASLIDEEEVPRATSLLWVDAAEVYSLCSVHYRENRDGAWTGSTENPHFEELRQRKERELREGRPCSFCKSDRVDEVKARLEDEVDVDVTVVR